MLSGFTVTCNESSEPTEHLLKGASPAFNVHGGGGVIVYGDSENISGNVFGVPFVVYGSNSSFSADTFRSNVDCEGSNNKLYHNIFAGGNFVEGYGYSENVYATLDSTNVWDDGYPSGGNYWGYYATLILNASMLNNSGISDKPYVINKNNTDEYPLLQPFNDSFLANYLEEVAPPKVSVISPINQTYGNSTPALIFLINKPANWVGYSLDGQQNITLTGNTTISNMADGSHTVTIYANNTSGYFSSETVTFAVNNQEPSFFSSLVVLSVIVLLVFTTTIFLYRSHRKIDKSRNLDKA